ncbi:MAG TPA: hypothetical protein VK506_14345 [Conexibacter sp.]|nr:hypothetical protein [Conexibacter sp.]
MSRSIRHARRLLLALLLAALAATAIPAAAGAVLVTVRVEGERATLVAPTQVAVGAREARARSWDGLLNERMTNCAADTAYQAVELAVRGNWDRGLFASRIMGESHTFSGEDYWVPYHKNAVYTDWAYSDVGLCDLHLREGSVVLLQAGVSGPFPDFIPASVPLEIQRVTPASGDFDLGDDLRIDVTAWIPDEVIGRENGRGQLVIEASEARPAVGYTVSGPGIEARTTDANGEARIEFNAAGRRIEVRVERPGSSTNWGRSSIYVCVEDEVEGLC